MKYLSLTIERLVLREFDELDSQAVHEYVSDPEVVRYMEWGPNTGEESRNFVWQAIAYNLNPPSKLQEQ